MPTFSGPQLAEGVTVGEIVDKGQTGIPRGPLLADDWPLTVDNRLLYWPRSLTFALYPQTTSLNLRFRPQAVDNCGDNFLELYGHDF